MERKRPDQEPNPERANQLTTAARNLPMGQWSEQDLVALTRLPKAVQEICLAYGPDYDFTFNPAGIIAETIFTPEELTQEAIDEAWRKVWE